MGKWWVVSPRFRKQSAWEVNPRPSEVWEAEISGMSGEASRMKSDSANGYVQCYWSEKKNASLPWKTNMEPKNGGLEDWKIGRWYSSSIGVGFRFHVNFPACHLKDPKSRVIFKNNFSFCISLCPKYHVRLSHIWHHVIPSHIITSKAQHLPAVRGKGHQSLLKEPKWWPKHSTKQHWPQSRAPFGYKHLSTKGDVYYSPWN